MKLWLPPSALIHKKKPRFRCTIPGCDAVFYEGEESARVRHALHHRDHDDDVIEALAKKTRDEEIYGPADDEYLDWMRERFERTGSMDPDDY